MVYFYKDLLLKDDLMDALSKKPFVGGKWRYQGHSNDIFREHITRD